MKAKDTFKVNLKNTLSSDDFKVLTLLYQPLLGIDAYALFQTLYHVGNNVEYKHQELFDLINIKQMDFLKAREKLEAIGLLDVYKKEGEYIYIVKNPFTATQFINDTILGSYLESVIGKKSLERMIELFKVEMSNICNYNNITKSFNDIYQSKDLETLKPVAGLRGRTNNNSPLIEENFSYDEFINKVSNRVKKAQLINPKTQELLNRLSFIYQFSVEDLVTIYNDTIDDYGNINYETLKLKSRLYYQKNNLCDCPSISEVSENPHHELLDNTTPRIILQQYSKTIANSSTLDDINSIIERSGVSIGVLNVILIHILKHKDGILPNKNYIEKVIVSWHEKGITNTKLALEYASELEGNQSATKTSKNKRVSVEPDWLEDAIKDLGKGGW